MDPYRVVLAGFVVLAVAGSDRVSRPALAAQAKTRGLPLLEVDRAWPKVPAKWKLGDVSSGGPTRTRGRRGSVTGPHGRRAASEIRREQARLLHLFEAGTRRPHRNSPGPRLFWMPSIGAAGMTFYTGDKFKPWKGNLFVAGLSDRSIVRVKFNKDLYEETFRPREGLLRELRQRMRDVRQGPDGLLYALTDGYMIRDTVEGVVLRIEPEE
jgi:hypothetical protein